MEKWLLKRRDNHSICPLSSIPSTTKCRFSLEASNLHNSNDTQ